MKRIPSLRKHNYIARVGIFLIAVALVVVGLGCPLSVTMTVNPAVGGTTSPSGTLSYEAGTTVNITATPNLGYQFAIWTAVPPVTFAIANRPSTNFVLTQNVTVTAHFVKMLEHFKCYEVKGDTAPYIGENVILEDQFGTVNAKVESAEFFGNPAEKWLNDVQTPIGDRNHHLTVYNITTESEPKTWQVEVVNQFGLQQLTVSGPVALAVPTWKVEPGSNKPEGLDHFLLYEVVGGNSVGVTVSLDDQFDKGSVWVGKPSFFANPVRKSDGETVTEIVNPEAHLVFYELQAESFEKTVQVVNQFGEQTLDVYYPRLLAVPSEKI